jgi:hypothetical protein
MIKRIASPLLLINFTASPMFGADAEVNWNYLGAVRIDAEQSAMEKKVGSAQKTKETSSEVRVKNAMLLLNGTRGSDRMMIRMDFEKPGLGWATITHKFNDNVSLTAGYMSVLVQGWEWDASPFDLYLFSLAGFKGPFGSRNGAKLEFTAGEHSLTVQAVNGESSVRDANGDTITFRKCGGLTSAVQYRGNFNGIIRPIATYTLVKLSSSVGDKKDKTTVNYGNGYQTQVGVGTLVDAGGANLDFEYNSVTAHKTKDPGDSKDKVTKSIIAQVRYPVGSSIPFLKVTSDTETLGAVGDVGDISQTQFAVGTEHWLDKSSRLHGFITGANKTTNGASGNGDTKETIRGFNFGITGLL